MPIRLKRHEHVFTPVTVRAGAVWRLRRATSIDVGIAQLRASKDLAGVLTGSDKLAALQEIFGEMFDLGEEVDPERLAAVTQFLGDVHLALMCSDGWSGMVDDDGAFVPEPSAGAVAMLLADPMTAHKVRNVLYETLLEESEEKNASSASPNGGAGAGSDSAGTATTAASPAPTADAPATGAAAPNSSTHH